MNINKAKRNINRILEQMKLEALYDKSLLDTKMKSWMEDLDDALAFLGD